MVVVVVVVVEVVACGGGCGSGCSVGCCVGCDDDGSCDGDGGGAMMVHSGDHGNGRDAMVMVIVMVVAVMMYQCVLYYTCNTIMHLVYTIDKPNSSRYAMRSVLLSLLA